MSPPAAIPTWMKNAPMGLFAISANHVAMPTRAGVMAFRAGAKASPMAARTWNTASPKFDRAPLEVPIIFSIPPSKRDERSPCRAALRLSMPFAE